MDQFHVEQFLRFTFSDASGPVTIPNLGTSLFFHSTEVLRCEVFDKRESRVTRTAGGKAVSQHVNNGRHVEFSVRVYDPMTYYKLEKLAEYVTGGYAVSFEVANGYLNPDAATKSMVSGNYLYAAAVVELPEDMTWITLVRAQGTLKNQEVEINVYEGASLVIPTQSNSTNVVVVNQTQIG